VTSTVYATKIVGKGENTRTLILHQALSMALRSSLDSLTIATIADEMKMSKTGVFARFGSREKLQLGVLRLYRERFERAVLCPATEAEPGLPRLISMFRHWIQFEASGFESGSIYISGAVEYENRTGPLRDALVAMIDDWQAALRQCVDMAIHLRHLPAATDAAQFVYEVYGLILGMHHDMRVLRRNGSAQRSVKAFNRLLFNAEAPRAYRLNEMMEGAIDQECRTRNASPPFVSPLIPGALPRTRA
jgi:AcrR family transcriptional regulator